MVLYFTMIAASAIVPLMMFIFGIIFIYKPPSQINGLYGYRTRRSMLNQDSWDYAHRLVGGIWSKLSLVLFTVSLIPFMFITDKSEDVMGMTGVVVVLVQTLIMVLSIIPVERALKRKYDK